MRADVLRAACVGLFMKALIVEHNSGGKLNLHADMIARRVSKYLRAKFKGTSDQELLASIVNKAWDDACTFSENLTISVSAVCLTLYDSRYGKLLEDELGIKPKFIKSFYEGCRSNIPIAVRRDSQKLSKEAISLINKGIYDAGYK